MPHVHELSSSFVTYSWMFVRGDDFEREMKKGV